MSRFHVPLIVLSFSLFLSACGSNTAVLSPKPGPTAVDPKTASAATPEPTVPPTLREILDKENTQSDSPLTEADFLNMTYPLPRGWQHIDSKEISLIDGKRRMSETKIGMSFVTKKFGDVNGDGVDEAFVILRVDTGGSATPHIVYVFAIEEGEPEIIWYFRTGDRADGGLKNIYAENDELIVELFGQDRYIFDSMETLPIVGDKPQLCCPTSFTKNRYKRVAKRFELQKERLTYSLEDPTQEPEINLGEKRLKEGRGKK